nr:VWA domain-containing protein [Roseibacillus sp.]
IKEFEADTNLRAYFVVDCSGSMKYASGEFDSKIQFARKFAGTMAYLLVNQGDAAGLSCCADKLHLELPPSRRPAHLQNFFEVLGELEPKGETGLVDALHTVAEKVGQRAFIFILSDLFCDPDALGDALQHLRYRKHDVAVFHLMDPQEIDFDFTRPYRFVDLEDDTSIVVEPNLIANEYTSAIQEFLVVVEARCHDVHADYHLVTSDQDYEEILRDFLTNRLPKKGKR